MAAYADAAARGDAQHVGATAGEAIGLIHDIVPAGAVVQSLVAEAEAILGMASARVSV